ncbi:MAG: membrane protein insertion efficiency factor YidD [Hellea sp.]|jgi:putative membrane protein insertion efficiency factor|nr:membrane protein insertion efficiency factor YidD [Hellea sp.]
MKYFFKNIMLSLLLFYKYFLSPIITFFGIKCRHSPSCSEYSREAIKRHGAWIGGWQTLARLSRCHWFGTSGVDNVPKIIKKRHFWAPWKYGIWRKTNDD